FARPGWSADPYRSIRRLFCVEPAGEGDDPNSDVDSGYLGQQRVAQFDSLLSAGAKIHQERTGLGRSAARRLRFRFGDHRDRAGGAAGESARLVPAFAASAKSAPNERANPTASHYYCRCDAAATASAGGLSVD